MQTFTYIPFTDHETLRRLERLVGAWYHNANV